MTTPAVLLLALLALPAHAADLIIDGGVGVGKTNGKILSLSTLVELPWELKLNPRVGAIWKDNYFTGNPTGYVALPVGVIVDVGPVWGSVFVGPAVISETSRELDTIYQFWFEAAAGIQNDHLSIGAACQHLSNGGTNEGKDWCGIRVGWTF